MYSPACKGDTASVTAADSTPSHPSFHPQQSAFWGASTRAAAKARPSLPVLEGKAHPRGMLGGGGKQEAFSSFHVCIHYWLSQQQRSFHPVPMEFPRVSSRPFLTAGGGVCLAMVVVSPVSWRVRVAPARLARDAQHWSEQHRWVR